jgi:hypothetical protein
MLWSIPTEGLGYNRAYSFAYDGLNLLTAGNYTGGTTGAYNETFEYHKMGNITHLTRIENGAGLNLLPHRYVNGVLITPSFRAEKIATATNGFSRDFNQRTIIMAKAI